MNQANKSRRKDGSEILIQTVDLEFEVRDSSIIDFYGSNVLPSCQCEIELDEENIEYLQATGELQETASLAMQVVSRDKRCSKTRIKERMIESYYDKVIPQRMFLPEDAI